MKRVLCVLLAGSILLSMYLVAVSADDFSGTTAVEILSEKEILKGFDDGMLHGEEKLTRAQFARILCQAFEVETEEEKVGFDDLEKSHWAYEDIKKAVNAGWLYGYDNGNFGPDDNITYEQAVAIVLRVIGIGNGYNYPVSHLAAAIDEGICDNVNAFIGQEVTREQAARLIVNSMEYMAENSLLPHTVVKDGAPEEERAFSVMSGGGGGGGLGSNSKSAMPTASRSYAMSYDMAHDTYFNTEEYTSNEENVFKNTYTSPLSTFSIDADTASYSNLRRFIMSAQKIPSGSIRSEELINYFDYADASVNKGEVFGVKTEVGICPWNKENKLAMITVNGEELTEYMPSNLVFLIDTSGSMYSSNKLPLVKKALGMLLKKLSENDMISIVTYASGTRVALEPTPATESEKILGVIDGLQAGGGTAGASGINLAYDMAEKAKIDGNNRIILCTDGDFNVGISSTGDLEKLIEEKRQTGIYLSVLGFGMGNYKDNRMETLADKGNGNYAYIDNLREAKKVLVDEMSRTLYTIAKDVKIQVEFNPLKVKSYRLVGYENRVLNNEDFENDAKDAGELGCGATVTAFYEIVPSDGTEKADLKYQSVTPTGESELMNVKIRYKLPDGEESILREYPVADEVTYETSEDFKFASAVAELGMILNDSEFKGSSTLDSVIELAVSGKGKDEFGLRSEFIQLVDLYRYSIDN